MFIRKESTPHLNYIYLCFLDAESAFPSIRIICEQKFLKGGFHWKKLCAFLELICQDILNWLFMIIALVEVSQWETILTFEGIILQKSKVSFIYLNEAWFSRTNSKKKSTLNDKNGL